MDLLEMLMGSGNIRMSFEDFLRRFEDGPPSEGYADEEVLERYAQVAHKVSPSEYQQAARDAFSYLSPEDREELGQLLSGRAQGRGLNLPGLAPSPEQGFGNLDWLANIATQLHEQPGLLRDLLGGLTGGSQSARGGSIFSNPIAKAALAGIAAMLVKRVLAGKER